MSRLNVKKRRGFTLIEMLVVIAIIVTLMGLLLPAIQRAREAANRTRCQSNMRQLGFAAIQANDQFKRLPPLFGEYGGKGRAVVPPAVTVTWSASVFYHLMPYIEQKAIYDRHPPVFNLTGSIYANGGTIAWAGQPGPLSSFAGEMNAAMLPVPVFVCPSDSSGAVGGLDRNVEPTLGFALATTNYAANFLVFGSFGRFDLVTTIDALGTPKAYSGKNRLDSIVDGTTSTVLFSERLALCPGPTRDGASYWSFPPAFAPGKPVGGGIATNCGAVIGFRPAVPPGNGGFTWPEGVPTPTAVFYNGYGWTEDDPTGLTPFQVQPIPGLVDDYAASSFHGGGINVVMGDASVRFVGRHISRRTWLAVLTPNSGSPSDRPMEDWVD